MMCSFHIGKHGRLELVGNDGQVICEQVTISVRTQRQGWVELEKMDNGKSGVVASSEKIDGVSVCVKPDEIQVQGQNGNRIKDVKLDCGINASTAFTQGYQTWNLNKGNELGKDKRVKSIASKLGLSGMFMDTDNPCWKEFKGNCVESHGVVLLSLSESNYLMLGGTSCKSGVTSFWVGKSHTIFLLSFGEPGVCETRAESIILQLGGNAQDLLEGYATACEKNQDNNSKDEQLAMNSMLRDLGRAPVGWGSWYEFYEHVTAQDCTKVLKAISSDDELKKAIDVFQLDDGFQLNTGDWLETQTKFGTGDLSSVASDIEVNGFTPGLWIAPFIASKTSKVFREHPDWFIKRVDKPKKYVVGHINPAWKRGGNCSGGVSSMYMYVLDLSNPQVLEHITKTFAALRKMGWKFFKIDFLAAGMREGIRMDESVTRVEAYIQGCKAIRRGIGSDSFLLGCGAPLMASAQSNCFDSMRVSCDTAERWDMPGWSKMLIRDWAVPCCSVALWGNMTRWFMHDKLWRFNDPDCLVLRRKGNSMTESQIRTQITVLGMTGGLLLFTDNMSTLEEDRKRLAFGVLPTTPLCGRPIEGLTAPNEKPSVFELNPLGNDSLNVVVALINWSVSSSKTMTVPRDGFDFWTNKVYKKGDTITLGPCDVCALQCPRVDAMLVGNTLHLTALADERISETTSSTCTVTCSEELVLRSGSLVFNSSQVQVAKTQGISIVNASKRIDDDNTAVEILIESYPWSLQVECS